MPAVGLVSIGLLVPAWIGLAYRGAGVSRVLEADRVLEEQPLPARLELRSGWLGLPGGEIADRFVGGTVALDLRATPPARRGSRELRAVTRFPRRGRVTLSAPRLSIGDPLGLVRLERRGEELVQELLVLPRIERLRWYERDPGDRLHAAGGFTAYEPVAAIEVDGLRAYRQGTPASRIHWLALARGAGLLERRLRADGEGGPLVVLDARCEGPDAHLDAAVRAAASLTHELARRSGCDLLLPGERRTVHLGADLCAWPGVHARLAVVEGGPDAPAPAPAPRPRAGRLIYVTARPLDAIPSGVQSAGRGTVVLVLPKPLTPPPRLVPIFEVSGCVGYAAGALAREPAWRRSGPRARSRP